MSNRGRGPARAWTRFDASGGLCYCEGPSKEIEMSLVKFVVYAMVFILSALLLAFRLVAA